MAEWKSKVEKYVTFGEKDHWTCKLCKKERTGHRSRVIAHLTRIAGKGVEICPKITSEQVEELKRELGLGPDLTGADGQQPQQHGGNDDIRQENGNKKRKGASGSGTSGSNQREAEMSPLGALDPSSALGESISVSDGNIWSLQNLEKSVAAMGSRLDNPYTSSLRNVFGVEMVGEIVVADEPQPPCLAGFNPDLWKFYIETDTGIDPLWGGKLPLYEKCMSSTDEEERKVLLGFLESACSEVRNDLTSAPRNDGNLRWKLHYSFMCKHIRYSVRKRVTILHGRVDRVEVIEDKIREEAEQGAEMFVRKRKNDVNRWVGYAASFKSDVDDLNVAAMKSKSLEEILQLLSRANELEKIGDVVIETGTALLYPVPKDISSWNPTFMSCRSQLVNQMPLGQFPPQV